MAPSTAWEGWRPLTAWSVAGIVGPVLIAGLREAQLNAGVAKTLVYDRPLYILGGRFGIVGALAWLAVGIPFLVGVWIALQKAAALI